MFILIYFSSILKQENFAYARIRTLNQQVLINEDNDSCSRKQRNPLMGLELTTDRHPPITSQTRNSLRPPHQRELVSQMTSPYNQL